MNTPIETAISLIRDLAARGFFGSLELKFESGKLALLRKIETLKPDTECLRSNRGGFDVHS